MDLSPVTPDSIIITIIYTILIFWGVWVGVRMIYQGFRRPQELLNPLFGNRAAIIMMALIRKYTGPGPGADLLPREEVSANAAGT